MMLLALLCGAAIASLLAMAKMGLWEWLIMLAFTYAIGLMLAFLYALWFRYSVPFVN